MPNAECNRDEESLRARGAGCHWHQQLPWILLGIRTAPKDDTGFSPAQIVYGSGVRIPGTLCSASSNISPSQVFQQMSETLKSFVPSPTVFHGQHKTFIPSSLQSCSHVWLRVDRLRGALTQPYEGPYEIIESDSKTFLIMINGQMKRVSIDRLKPVHRIEDTNSTRYGRVVRAPKRFTTGK